VESAKRAAAAAETVGVINGITARLGGVTGNGSDDKRAPSEIATAALAACSAGGKLDTYENFFPVIMFSCHVLLCCGACMQSYSNHALHFSLLIGKTGGKSKKHARAATAESIATRKAEMLQCRSNFSSVKIWYCSRCFTWDCGNHVKRLDKHLEGMCEGTKVEYS
jgi:hypothetical protein